MNIRPEPPAIAEPVAPPPEAEPPKNMNPRTRALLQGPIVPTLLRMAWPNVLIMFAQAATGLIETFWVGRLGTDALAGMALVFPGVMLMQMFSAGAMGGGISSAIARALGAGKREQADALVLHALVINLAIGARVHRRRCWSSAGRSIACSAARALRSKRRSSIPTSCSAASCCCGS